MVRVLWVGAALSVAGLAGFYWAKSSIQYDPVYKIGYNINPPFEYHTGDGSRRASA